MKPHIWYRLDGRAFCLSCLADKIETLIGQPCPGRAAGEGALAEPKAPAPSEPDLVDA